MRKEEQKMQIWFVQLHLEALVDYGLGCNNARSWFSLRIAARGKYVPCSCNEEIIVGYKKNAGQTLVITKTILE